MSILHYDCGGVLTFETSQRGWVSDGGCIVRSSAPELVARCDGCGHVGIPCPPPQQTSPRSLSATKEV